MTDERRVVITGMGVASCLGIGVEALWDGLVQRRCGLGPIQAFDASGMTSPVGGETPRFKMTDFVPKGYRKSTKVMSRDIELAVVAAHEAVRDAALHQAPGVQRGEAEGPVNLDPARFGANIGAGLICADLHELAGAMATATNPDGRFSLRRWGSEGMNNLTPLWLLKFLPNMLACHVTIVHDAQAPSNTITCGEASSHLAIGEGFRTVARGDVDVCICGGAESKMNPMGVARQQLLARLPETSDHDPARLCRPFAADRCGAVPSEGGGLLILESLDHARKRGARIYAEVVGFGSTANTHDWRTPHPEGAGIALAIRRALEDAGVGAEAIDLMGAFGCGTREHDASELAAWTAVFGDHLAGAHALAIKGAVGNSGAGSGAVDIAAAVKTLAHGTLPPSPNTEPPDPACRLRFNPAGPVDAPIRRVCSVAYALGGGQNAALIMQRYQEGE